ncbi:unnamed protein product [Prunus armeniaca]
MAGGLRPATMDSGDWTWRMSKWPTEVVESDVGDQSLRLSRAKLKAFMLSSLPSTTMITNPRFPTMLGFSTQI